jgi:hypothetical protein
VRQGTTWSQQAYLKSASPHIFQQFGYSVAIAGETIAVGTPFDNLFASDAGSVTVFTRHGGSWSQQAVLLASNAQGGDRFGFSVALDGDTLLAGAVAEDSGATGVDGNQADESISASGAVYAFVRSGTSWSQQAYLKASNTDQGDWFGYSTSVSGDTAVVGAAFESSAATGVDGDGGDDTKTFAGAAYVFVRSGASWSQQAYLKASNTGPHDQFGESVSVVGDAIVVGAGRENSRTTGINGLQENESAPDAGAAYAFVRESGTWSQLAYIKASNTGTDDTFGFSSALSGDRLVVGAFNEDSSATGIDGPDNNETPTSGAAYVFDLGLDPWITLGSGLAGVGGVPALAGTGPLVATSAGTLELSGAAPSAFAMLFVSLGSTPAPFVCGTLVPVPILLQLPVATSGSGEVNLSWASWPGGLSGASLHFQYAIQDVAALCGVSLSHALRADVP